MRPDGPRESVRERALFALSVAILAAASVLAGAALRPAVDRLRGPRELPDGERVAFLEHAALDVRSGRAATLAQPLRDLALRVKDSAAREPILRLWAEAARQAGELSEAAVAEEQREALVTGEAERNVIRLRRIELARTLGRMDEAQKLAAPLLRADDARIADEARIRLVAGGDARELRASIASRGLDDAEQARRAGLAALRLLGDAEQAERLLAPLLQSGRPDASLCEALVETYDRLERPAEVAKVLGLMLDDGLASGEPERSRLVLMRAAALARAGAFQEALAAVELVRRSPDVEVRRVARRTRYDLLRQTGQLAAESKRLRDPEERAFVAMEIERDFAAAARFYREAGQLRPESPELAERLREAERRLALSNRKTLYEQVLASEPSDEGTRQKLLTTLVALGQPEDARRWVSDALRGREQSAEALTAAGVALERAGLHRDAAAYLDRAQAAEPDPGRKEQILLALGDLYATARQLEAAHRVFAKLAGEGASPEIRERAAARLVSLLQ